jgi:hypothetical protein
MINDRARKSASYRDVPKVTESKSCLVYWASEENLCASEHSLPIVIMKCNAKKMTQERTRRTKGTTLCQFE